VVGRSFFGAKEIKDSTNIPSVPKYLVYLNTCAAGWEPSLGKAWVGRGTRNVIAFRKYIPDGDARQMARDFHKKWSNTHKNNPEKIPEVFFDVGSAYYKTMKPVLFGKGGGKIKDPDAGLSPLATAAIVIGALVLGAAIGFAVYKILK
jgi:hypothetical protein